MVFSFLESPPQKKHFHINVFSLSYHRYFHPKKSWVAIFHRYLSPHSASLYQKIVKDAHFACFLKNWDKCEISSMINFSKKKLLRLFEFFFQKWFDFQVLTIRYQKFDGKVIFSSFYSWKMRYRRKIEVDDVLKTILIGEEIENFKLLYFMCNLHWSHINNDQFIRLWNHLFQVVSRSRHYFCATPSHS